MLVKVFVYMSEMEALEDDVVVEARLARCRARLAVYIEEDAARQRRNAALLREVRDMWQELHSFGFFDGPNPKVFPFS